MFFEENLHDTAPEESALLTGDGPLQPLSQASDGGASASPSLGHTATSLGLDGFSFASGTASTAGGGVAGIASTQSASAAAIQLLIEATANERFSPEVLPYPESTVNAVVDLIQRTQQRLETLVSSEMQESATRSLLPFRRSDIIGLELQRVQFFLCELLRCRMRKIDQLAMSIYYEGQLAAEAAPGTDNASQAPSTPSTALPEVRVPQRRHLSAKEQWVADRLARSAHAAVVESGLHAAPAALQHLVPFPSEAEGLEVLPEPDLGAYVFGVALEDLGVVNLGEGGQDASRAINAGELFLTPYRNFRPHVMSGQVRLV